MCRFKSPPVPADVQVTHTTPTRRSALYSPLPVPLGHWGTRCRRCHVIVIVVVVVVGFWREMPWAQPHDPTTLKRHEQHRPLGRHCLCRFFVAGLLGGLGGCVGVCGGACGCGWVGSYWWIRNISKKSKKRKKSGLSHSFCAYILTGVRLHTLSPHPRLP